MNKAFTLAEVLITLGIIGIIATLTMPALVANYQEKATVTKLKKFYSVMSQAYAQAEQEYGDPTNWDLIASGSVAGAKNAAEKFKPFLKIVDERAQVFNTAEGYVYYLADGVAVDFVIRSANCTHSRGPGRLSQTCAVIDFDINEKDPRKPGQNVFSFLLLKDGIVPSGTPESTGNQGFYDGCLKASKEKCTAWVIYNENMDYLHCDDLSWDGKTRCD